MNIDDDKVQEFLDKLLPHLKFDPPSRIMAGASIILIFIWVYLRLAFELAWADYLALPMAVMNVVICLRCLKKRRYVYVLGAIIGILLAATTVFHFRFREFEHYNAIRTVLFIGYFGLFAARETITGF